MTKEEVLREFIKAYNKKDLKKCCDFFSKDIELRSSYLGQLFPESKGIIIGKEALEDYLVLVFKSLSEHKSEEFTIKKVEQYYIVQGNNIDNTLNYYLHYYINDEDLIYLIKSNLTQPL